MSNENEKAIQDLVVARLQALPRDKEISIGSDGEFSKEQLISHVLDNDAIGQKIIAVEMSFLRALKDGILYDSEYLFSNPT